MADCSGASLHPDLRQVWCKIITADNANDPVYEIYPHAAYLLSARLTARPGTTELGVLLVTNPAPGVPDGDDEAKVGLYIGTTGQTDSYPANGQDKPGGVFFENGIYARLPDAVTDADTAWLQVEFVPRSLNCAAFPYPEEGLQECWDAAHNEGRSQSDPAYLPIYTNFWDFRRENPEEPVEEPTGGDAAAGDPI